MKSRSHRPPMLEPRHDDWVDGSWTVDCICGVNFDDGEEMVDCDECGVWVHTRCSRYVKSEKSFSCDKCKSKNGVGGNRNDSEETEVAEFLLELPTKTMLDAPNPASIASRKTFKLWTDIPMEKRVHVQGVPGGEPGFFERSKMSSIFGPRLWNCAGYVPKQFTFQYTEFPCLVEEKSEDEMDKESGEGNGDQVNDGAGALISFLRVAKSPFPTSNGNPVLNCPSDVPVSGQLLSPTQNKKSDVENPEMPCTGQSLCEEATSEPVVLDSTKREVKQNIMLNDQQVKKLRTAEKDGDFDNQVSRDSEAGHITHTSPRIPLDSSDVKHFDSSQERGSKASNHHPGECATNLALKGHNLNHGDSSIVENKEAERRPGSSIKTCSDVKSSTKFAESRYMPLKEKVPNVSSQSTDVVAGSTGRSGTEFLANNPVAEYSITGGSEAEKAEDDQKLATDMANERPMKKQKRESVDEYSEINLKNGKATIEYSDVFAEGVKLPKTLAMGPESNDSQLHYAGENQNLNIDDCKADNPDYSSPDLYDAKIESKTSEVDLGPRKKSLNIRNSSEVPDGILKLNGDSQMHFVGATSVKSSSNSGGMAYSSTGDHVALDSRSLSTHNGLKDLSERIVGNMRGHASADMLEQNPKCGRPKKIAKESSGSGFVSKIPDSTKISHTSNSRGTCSDSKDFSFSSSNVPHLRSVSCTRFSDNGVNQSPGLQDKVSAAAVPSKGEKVRQSICQTLSKGNIASASASSNVPAALSDEELALLLHQELNSSPRVPRVSRMRNAGSLPQITSSSGGKEQILSYRKKSKDLSGEASHGYLRSNVEVKKVERKPSSPDNTRQDSASSIDQHSQKEADCGSIKHVQSMNKVYVGGLSSHTCGNGSLRNCPSARNTAEDGSQMVTPHLTLPGLIAEIMSGGNRMTYEDLCNAVLPHWPHLRKHNGESYAYSSHSQAVLDCLRNRSEWARLVDRGPKTNAGRKKRKNDADSFSMELEESEETRVKVARSEGSNKSLESHQEDVPKGRRQARKRRGLASQERGGIMTRQRRADMESDYESESSKESTEDDESSEEEEEDEDEDNDDDGISTVRSEASSGSEATH